MKTISTMLLLLALAILPLTSGCSVARPLHRSQANIRASVLKRTPLGITKESVEAFIRKQGWKPIQASHPNTLEAHFGGYFIFFGTTEVYGIWTFGSDNRLIAFHVEKSRDVL